MVLDKSPERRTEDLQGEIARLREAYSDACDQITLMREELSRAAVRATVSRRVLRRLEYLDTATARGHQPVCPCCGAWRRKEDHASGCELDAVLSPRSPLADAAQEVLEAFAAYREDDDEDLDARWDRLEEKWDRYRALLDGREEG